MKIYNVFHISWSELAPKDITEPPPPVVMEGIKEPEYKVEKILDHWRSYRNLMCLVKWKGYLDSNNAWQSSAIL